MHNCKTKAKAHDLGHAQMVFLIEVKKAIENLFKMGKI